MASWTTSTKAATSWSVTRSRSAHAATNVSSTTGASARARAASSVGTAPSAAHASVASSSISSQRPSRAVSPKMAAISGREYRPITLRSSQIEGEGQSRLTRCELRHIVHQTAGAECLPGVRGADQPERSPAMSKRSRSAERLHDLPLFADCSAKELAEIDASLTAVLLPAGLVIVQEGTYSAELLIVAEGEVSVTRHTPAGDLEVAVLGAGDVVGEVALLEGTPHTTTVTTVTPVLIYTANPREFALLMSVPSVAAAIRAWAASRRAADRVPVNA